MKKVIWLVICFLASLALLAGGVWAAVFCVDSAAELSTTLDTAETNGEDDLIKVVQGTYYTDYYFIYSADTGEDITLEGGYTAGCASRVLDPENTVLDGSGAASSYVLYIMDTAGGDIQVEGFTIQNGADAGAGGGGIHAESYADATKAGNITLLNNIIQANSTTYEGGGVYSRSQSNSATAGNITLLNNIVTDNTADGFGGGVLAYSTSNSGDGGDVTLINNIIAGNTSAEEGAGGVYATSSSVSGKGDTVTLVNNTITGNSSPGATSRGGGLFLYSDDNTLQCYNNIIWGNTATTTDDIYVTGSGGTNYGYNNDYHEMSGSWNGGEDANIDADPLVVGGGDYHLRAASPCIDTGLNTAPGIPGGDFEGNDRILDGDYSGTLRADMGADEFMPIYVILHRDGAIWDADAGWTLTAPPYYPGTAYAVDLERVADGSMILHTDGALWNSTSGWTTTAPPYYPGTAYAIDAAYTNDGYTVILHRDGALWSSATGWTTTTPPYYPSTAYAKALEVRGDASYTILHYDGAIYDSASGWVTTSPPYYPGTTWAVDLKLDTSGYVILHRDGALWNSNTGWTLTAPPYYPTTDYARALELVGSNGSYVILHKDGAIYNSATGWLTTAPPYHPGTNYAVDLEVR